MANAMRGSLDWWNSASKAWQISWTRSTGRDAVAAIARQRTADLVRFVRTRSRFYRDAWKSLADAEVPLHELPAVSKRELMARFDDWVTDPEVRRDRIEKFLEDRGHIGEAFLGRYVVWKSSGSTGEPGVYVQDREALSTYDALLAVQLQSAQLAVNYGRGWLTQGGRAALIAALGDHFASIASWERVCRGMPWPNARAFSVMDPLPSLVASLNEYRPAFLASYPTMLALLATEQREDRLRIEPSCIWSGGEHLSATTRRSIEQAFGAPLVNEYGASECMSIAFSCPTGTLHVNADWVVVEPVDHDYRPTLPGERSHTVLITNLANRIQPIIRYDLGDSVVMDAAPCPCGNPLPTLRVEGRCDDMLALRGENGSVVRLLPLALTTIVEEAAPHHRFQLVQTAPDRIELRLDELAEDARTAQWNAVRTALGAFLERQSLANVHLALDIARPVPDARSGKVREVVVALADASVNQHQ